MFEYYLNYFHHNIFISMLFTENFNSTFDYPKILPKIFSTMKIFHDSYSILCYLKIPIFFTIFAIISQCTIYRKLFNSTFELNIQKSKIFSMKIFHDESLRYAKDLSSKFHEDPKC